MFQKLQEMTFVHSIITCLISTWDLEAITPENLDIYSMKWVSVMVTIFDIFLDFWNRDSRIFWFILDNVGKFSTI